MLREERRIRYTNEELVTALSLYCDASDKNFGFDPGASLSFENAPHLRVRVAAWNNASEAVSFDESEIAAGLIMFSKREGIPIPRNATKSIELAEGNILFVMRIEG